MSRAEHDAMVREGRVQPNRNTGQDAMHATSPADATAFANAPAGSVFVEFDVPNAQAAPGGRTGWVILFGPNSLRGKLAAQRGTPLAGMPPASNIVITGGN